MEVAVDRRVRARRGESGQTMVEYLMLLALAFITGYIVITGPVATFTTGMISGIRVGLLNVVQNAELTTSAPVTAGSRGHPTDPTRMKRLH
jgi:hypothetical protein